MRQRLRDFVEIASDQERFLGWVFGGPLFQLWMLLGTVMLVLALFFDANGGDGGVAAIAIALAARALRRARGEQ